jgi:serine/threonine-protein kinase
MADLPARIAAALADRYTIERQIGTGGMAIVFLAQDLRHQRKVAVKVLRPELAATLGGDRFFREIQIAAQLQHPNILPLLDSGEADGFLYYAMPFVEGESLRERLARGGELPVQEAVRLLVEVVDALAYAHARGVVHRDIKPDNVLLSGRHALLTDFGVAKAVSEATGRQQLTTAGVALGTPAYMAPEQASADPHVDHRADLYAVGVLGYELLAGRPPFTGTSSQEVLAAHVTQAPVPLATLRPSVPPAVAGVIMHCLEKRPADRWQSAEQLLAQLEPLATSSGGHTPAATPPTRSTASTRWLFLGGVAVGVIGLILLASRLNRPGAPAMQIGRRFQATLDPGLETQPSLSPDGKILAYAGGTVEPRIYVRQVEGGTPIPVARDLPGPQIGPAWSPDGKLLMFRSRRGVELVPALGGTPRVLVSDPDAVLLYASAWSPDGRQVAYRKGESTYVAGVDGSGAHPLGAGGNVHSMAWSPDGKWIAYVYGNPATVVPGTFFGNLAPSEIRVSNVAGDQVVRVTDDTTSNLSPAWTPDGTLLFISNRDGGRDLYAVRIGRDGRPQGSAARLTTGLNAQAIAISSDGSRLAYTLFTETSNVWSVTIPPGGTASISAAREITSGNQVIESFDVSPDGRWLVFDSNRRGNSDIYRIPLDRTGEPEQLTSGPLDKFFPSFSPDGREVVFHSFVQGRRQIYVIPSTGGNALAVVSEPDDDRAGLWSPDGRNIFYTANLTSPTTLEARVVTRDAAGAWGKPRLWRPGCLGPFPSPDSKLVACTTKDVNTLIGTMDGDSLRTLMSAPYSSGYVGVATFAWSPDSRCPYFLKPLGDSAGVWQLPVTGGSARRVLRFDDEARQWHRFGFRMRDGRIYLTLGDLQSDVWVAEIEGKR